MLAPNTSATVLCKHHYNALHCYCNDTFFVAEVSSFSEVVLFLKAKTIEYCKADIFVGQNFVDHNSQKLPPPLTPTQKIPCIHYLVGCKLDLSIQVQHRQTSLKSEMF